MSMRGRAEFRRAVAQLQAECDALDMTVSSDGLEDILAGAVRTAAAAMRVREETFVRSYLATINLHDLAAVYRTAEAEGLREVADTPPTILDLASAGRLIASLGQAVWCVSVNHASIARAARDKWQAIGVLDSASNALTLLGAAMDAVDVGTGRVSVLINDETVVHARRALRQALDILTNGDWSFHNGTDLDEQVAARMAADLKLLPAA
jgi:hypothetical protein